MTFSRRVMSSLAGAIVVLALIALVPDAPVAIAQQPAPAAGADSAAIAAEILRLTQKYSDALETNNVAAMDSLLASDAWVVRPTGDRHRKADWLAHMAQHVKFTKHDVGRTILHVHGDDVVVAVSQQKPAGTAHGGGAMASSNVASRIWVKRAGQWQIVLETITRAGGAK